MFNLHFNQDQKLELSKALFNLGNLFFSIILLSQVSNNLDIPLFLFGTFCFVTIYPFAIVLINDERRLS